LELFVFIRKQSYKKTRNGLEKITSLGFLTIALDRSYKKGKIIVTNKKQWNKPVLSNFAHQFTLKSFKS
jgi:hypothetical protein